MINTSANSSFSKHLPGLQLAVDSTSLGEAKSCLRKYFYSIIEGWQPRQVSVHLTFGLLVHGALERYAHAKVAGLGHDAALRAALSWVLERTWDSELGRPWTSDHKTKNRLTLVRTVVWYLDQFQEDVLETVILTNGKPAVELSFRFDSGYRTSTGEAVLYCGHIDRIARFLGKFYILDPKTTAHTIGPDWFKGFTPFNQFSMYSLAGKVAFGFPVEGLLVDGIQVAAGFSRFARGLVPRDEAMLEEWHRDNAYWLVQMNHSALMAEELPESADPASAWPMNDKSCDMWGGCQFREVCSRSPGARQAWLEGNFRRRVWDPLVVRGDI